MNAKLVKGDKNTLDYLHFTDKGFSCKLVPAMGGSLQELIINDATIIWGCTPDESGMQTYRKFCNSGWLFPFPNRIEDGKYSFEGTQYQLDINDPKFGHAIHGVVYDQEFEIIAFDDHYARLEYTFPGNDGFPFPFNFTVQYEISNNQIDIKIIVKNTGQSKFPFGMGWHPYFQYNSDEDRILTLSAINKYDTDLRMIPTEAKPFMQDEFVIDPGTLDDVFEVGNKLVSINTESYRCELITDFGNYFQVYAPKNEQAVAVEPMSCIGNAFNNGIGLETLAAGEKIEWNFRISVEMS